MKRREFLTSSLATVGLAGAETDRVAAALTQNDDGKNDDGKREVYELRLYTFPNEPVQTRFESYLREALLPAMKRIGNSPVGVFTVKDKPDSHTFTVLIPYPSFEAFATVGKRLATDAEYGKAGAPVRDLPSSDPPYTRVESWLLMAFAGFPKLQLPAETAAGKGRTFELRTYESHSEKAGKKKIEMFDVGEIGVFQRAGFQPVFFGETRIGAGMPRLTYMVTYPDGMERDTFWSKFRADPECKTLFANPAYSDKEIVSKIHSVLLRPAACSQI